ncbi:MAG: mdoG [Lacunisphaera sp.]|nr:mdoG [Lacunisphaera sp.]
MKSRVLFFCALLLAGRPYLQGAEAPFDFEVLQFRAKTLAGQPYKAPPNRVPPWLQQFGYDQYRDIRFDPMRAWWREQRLPFQLQFFHPGGLYSQMVDIHELNDKESKRIDFSARLFSYGGSKPGRIPSDLGFAGFRIHYALNNPVYLDELAVFLGASYFRALGTGQHYGLSARGLAVNSGDMGEEFPAFQEFWIERPAYEAKSITLYALMDSPSLAGAYKFIITPGADTVMRIKAAVYCRKNPRVFGIAPLTSMFEHGENTGWSQTDYRPEVHDSDGLLIENGTGEWLWRPLVNPKATRVVDFMDSTPHGFGLLQRDQQFEHYDDLEAFYHQRPSTWVEPIGNWGPGAVRLVELPTNNEASDNIVAFWVPAQLPPPGEPIVFEYNLHWMLDPNHRPPAGYVTSTRIAQVVGRADLRRFVVEFAGPYLNGQPDDPDIEAVLTVGPGARHEGTTVVQKNRFSGAWRVIFEIKPAPAGPPVELRCFLRKGQHVLTETWSYLWNP